MQPLIRDNALRENGKILWDKRTDSFHLIVNWVAVKGSLGTLDARGHVALDPGVRAFQTFYDPADGAHGELLADGTTLLQRQEQRVARLLNIRDRAMDVDGGRKQSSLEYKIRKAQRKLLHYQTHSAETNKQGHGALTELENRVEMLKQQLAWMKGNGARKSWIKGCQRRLNAARAKIRNWMQNAHYDAANFLLVHYRCILLPALPTQRLSRGGLAASTKRRMFAWSHYKFRQRLLSRAELYMGREVLLIEEPGTSKTCGHCGKWKEDLGGNKTYACKRCGVVLDRDVNGARNNLLAAYGRWVGVGPDEEAVLSYTSRHK
jgi:exonuclease VII small subunit